MTPFQAFAGYSLGQETSAVRVVTLTLTDRILASSYGLCRGLSADASTCGRKGSISSRTAGEVSIQSCYPTDRHRTPTRGSTRLSRQSYECSQLPRNGDTLHLCKGEVPYLGALSSVGVHNAESLLWSFLLPLFSVRSFAGLTVPSEQYFCTYSQFTLLGCRAAPSGTQRQRYFHELRLYRGSRARLWAKRNGTGKPGEMVRSQSRNPGASIWLTPRVNQSAMHPDDLLFRYR